MGPWRGRKSVLQFYRFYKTFFRVHLFNFEVFLFRMGATASTTDKKERYLEYLLTYFNNIFVRKQNIVSDAHFCLQMKVINIIISRE
jgi:hypothetical protein